MIESNCAPTVQKIPIEERGGPGNIQDTVYGAGCYGNLHGSHAASLLYVSFIL